MAVTVRRMALVRLVLADDHALVREGTRRILEAEADMDVVGEAADGEEAVRLVAEVRPDVAIIDIGMPRMNGLEATVRIKEVAPEVAVLVLTVHDDDEYVFSLLDAGAAGYLLKDVPGSQLVSAVRALQAGEPVLHPAVARKLLARFHGGGAAPPAPLSAREIEIVRLAAHGMTNKEIGRQLLVSTRTVQAHLGHIFVKIGVASRTEAVVHALRRGWIRLDETEPVR